MTRVDPSVEAIAAYLEAVATNLRAGRSLGAFIVELIDVDASSKTLDACAYYGSADEHGPALFSAAQKGLVDSVRHAAPKLEAHGARVLP